MMSVATLTCFLLSGLSSAQFCPTLHADFLRRQAEAPFNSATPYNETHGAKHVPYITVNGSKGTVTVGDGNPYHPMVASSNPATVHFITHIYVLDQDLAFVAMGVPDPLRQVAQIEFDIPSGTTKLQAFEWCNKHGLWKGPWINVAAGPKAGTCMKPTLDSAAPPSLIADMTRRQAIAPFNASSPFNETHGHKHVPYITLNGSMATVVVGDGNPFHPMVASSDPKVVHFVTHIYVRDQNGNIVSMQNLDPSNMSMASMTFTVPDSATSLTAFEFCNKHGLWQGPTVQVSDRVSGKGLLSGTTMVRLGMAASFIAAVGISAAL